MRENRTFYFSTLGIYVEDLEFIDRLLERYGVSYYSVDAGPLSFSSLRELIAHAQNNTVSSFFFHGKLENGEGSRVSLQIIGAVSSWEVSLPDSSKPASLAIAEHVFLEVKKRLAMRRSVMATLPWHVARNAMVWIPLLLLAAKTYLPLGDRITDVFVIRTTVGVAMSLAILAHIDRRRYYKTAITKPPRRFERTWGALKPLLVISVTSFATVLSERLISSLLSTPQIP